MAFQRGMLSYWNGSAWVNVVSAGTTTSALLMFEMADVLGTPSEAQFRIANISLDPFADSGSAKGPYSGIFTEFMPIRLTDQESKMVVFYGVVFNVREINNPITGMVIVVTARDFLTELKDNVSDGELGFNLDVSVAVGTYNTNWAESNKDLKSKRWSTGISTKGAVIKSLISKTTPHLTVAGDANRFVDSVKPFPVDSTYKLGGRNNKSILAHIASLSATDSHNASGEQLFGYDYYQDPNFTSAAASQKPTAFFNYFKRGTRPNAVPTTYGLNIKHPSVTPTGRLQGMTSFDFESPSGEIYTDALVKFPYTTVAIDGTAATELRNLNFEVLQVKGESAIESLRCAPFTANTAISTHPTLAHGLDEPTVATHASEWMRVKLDGSGDYDESSGTLTTIARIQYSNKTQNETINDANPAYVLISEVDESINDTAFADGVKWYGKEATSSYITLKSRPRVKYGIRRTFRTSFGSEATADSLREQLASTLIKTSNQADRGSFNTPVPPRFYIDNSPTSVSGTTTQTITLSGSVNPLNYGFREGMVVMELDAAGETTATYGYASSVSSTQVVVTWSTGQISASNTVRYYVPVRAGDVIHVRNDLVNIDGIFLVTKLVYNEQNGILNTAYEVIEQGSLNVGGTVKASQAAKIATSVAQQMNLPIAPAQSSAMANAVITCTFSSTTNGTTADADGIYWTAGSLNVGIEQYAINQAHTSEADIMVTSGNGNTGQSGTALAAGIDYYIYYPGTGLELQCIRKAAYINVSSESTVLVAHCKAGTTRAEFTIFTGSLTEHSDFKGDLTASTGTFSGSLNVGDVTGDNMNITDTAITGYRGYSTGTAAQSGTTVTGTSTVWTAAHIGGTFAFDGGGGGGTISAVASNTSLTVSNSATVSSDDYTISVPKFRLKSTGSALTVHGEGAGGTSSSTAGQNAAAILIENGGYVSFISAGAANSDTRFDAALHDFRNFGTGAGTTGAITGLRYLTFSDTSNTDSILALNDLEIATDATDETITLDVGGTDVLQASTTTILQTRNILPSEDSEYDLGSASNRWVDIHADNATIQTSDRRLKEQIQPTTLGLDFIKDLKPVSYRWKDTKNRAPRTHYGIIAQEVLETLEKHGITDRADFAGIVGNEEEYYGARYTEFVAILIKAVQELSSRIEKLEGK